MNRELRDEFTGPLSRRRFVKDCLGTTTGAACLNDFGNAFGASNEAITAFTYRARKARSMI
jgi:hypothetical protein